MILVIVIASVLFYLAVTAASKAFFRVYWFPGDNDHSSWDEMTKEGSSYFCATFWPITLPLFGVKKLAELIEKELQDKGAPK
jgi:flavoprotein